MTDEPEVNPETGAKVHVKVSNISDLAVGISGDLPPLQPGETFEDVELDEVYVKALEGFERVEVQRLDRPESGSHKKATAKSGNKGSGQ